MVCMGNICRSPMAEGIMKQKLIDFGLDAYVDSAGTLSYHAGENPDLRAQYTMRKNELDITNIISRPFQQSDFDEFDKIFVMDHHNYNELLNRSSKPEHQKKVTLIMNMIEGKKNHEVPDPYYGGKDGFDKVYKMLDDACTEIAIAIQNNSL
jgi:protein-tyrosine phosphatase